MLQLTHDGTVVLAHKGQFDLLWEQLPMSGLNGFCFCQF
ncbi:hypothetical protein KL86DES1_10033 [uncultured Desulfovibrio sp.]|uniref:Uncharacterized protein n=1 Tax=uncultured Desulfovibrio sp. TaxID=167968 RepID=A0A212KXB2_9BACT|nr:hypothetical protein KL86DES1_10033 [uncultured Desulfovibrio sp.]VZH35245.1 conserved protein of unknown function [Desulfovibrio sp. 86]